MKGWLDKYQDGGVAKTDATRTSPALNYRSVEDSARIEREKEIARRKTSIGAQSKPSVAMKQAAEERYAQQKRNEKYKKIAEYAQVIGGGLEVAAPFTGPLYPIVGGAGTITSAGSSAYLAGRDVAEEKYGSALMNAGFGGLGIAGYTPAARATNIRGVNVANAANAADYVSDVATTYNAYDDYGSNYAQRIQNIRQHVTDDELQDILRPRRSLTPYNNKLRSHPDDGFFEPQEYIPDPEDPFIPDIPDDFFRKPKDVGSTVMGMPIPSNLRSQNALRHWSTYNELSTTGGSNFLQQFREQNGYLTKKSLLGKLKDKAGKVINKADEKLGELISSPKSLPEGVSLEKLSDEINKELTKGVGVKKLDIPLRINLAGNLDQLYANTQIIDPATNKLINAGNIHFARQQKPYGSKKFSEVLFPNKKQASLSSEDVWKNTLGFAKKSDFPFTNLSEQDKAILEKQGVSGEFNKAINEVLKRNNLGNILSGGSGHTPKGAERWENLIQKGLAEDLGGRFYKLKKNGGWLEKYNDGGPVQPNYNEYSVSAPEGFEGDGYSNVGRNYSPAWGGQFKDGGPIYTTNPKDPRLQAYKDSSILYNNYVKQYSAKGKNRPLTKEEIKLAIEQRENPLATFPNTKVLNVKGSNKVKKYHYSDSSGAYNAELIDDMFHPVIKPIGSYLYQDHNFWNTNINNIYKKPTQPIIYQKPEPTPQSTIDFMEGNYAEEPVIETPQPQASAYGEVVDPRTGYTHMTRQGSPMYPMVSQKVPEMAMGGSLPGATGFMYARVGAPSNGKYAKKTMASAQNGTELENAYAKWPALKNMGPAAVNKDYGLGLGLGYGGVEFMHPDLGEVNYDNGVLLNQSPGKNSTTYNPLIDDAQSVRLDMLHGMHQDPTFSKHRDAFKQSVLSDPSIKADMNHWYNEDKKKGRAGDGKDQWMNNYIDGQMRTLLFEGDRKSRNYSDKEANQLLFNPKIKKSFNKLNDYLKAGYSYGQGPRAKNGKKVIKDDRGQWDHPGEITEIGSNQITMRGVPYPVLGISDTGDTKMMYPNQEYQYDGESVTEIPMMREGGTISKKTLARNQRIAESNAAQNQPLTPESLATRAIAIPDKLRLSEQMRNISPDLASWMEENPTMSYIDENLNPLVIAGKLASKLGQVPLNVKQGNYRQALLNTISPMLIREGAITTENLSKSKNKFEQGGQLTKLDQLTNFTNYNTKQPGGWLDKYQ